MNPFILPPAFNAASVVTTSAGNTTYSLGTPVAVDGGLTVTDADDVNLSSATVSISGGFQSGQDILQFSNQNGITGSYNAATGILTLTGTSTVENYQTALRSVTYNNIAVAPDRADRTISFATNDGNASSNIATKVVVFPNDPPVITTSAGSTGYTLGAPVIIDGGITVTDDNANLSSATISITGNFQSAEDELQFTNQNGITGSYNPATGVLTLSGSSTVANYQTALRSITYNNSSAGPNPVDRIISFSVNDGTSNSNTATRTITIPPTVTVNQAPGQNDPANTSPVLFRVQFSKTVNGFAANDVIVTGPAGSVATVLPPSAPEFAAGTYTVSVSGMTADGTITVSIGANAVTDLAGNPNTASTSTDNSVTYDATKPTVTINQAAAQIDPTNASPINFTVVFSEPVSNFATGDITLSGTANATTAVITGSGTTYNVAVSGMSGSGTVIATIGAGVATDAAGNTNTASTSTDNTVIFDNTLPTLTSVHIQSNNANTAKAKVGDIVTVSFTSSEAVTGTSVSIAGHPVAVNSAGGNNYTASYTMVIFDTEGAVSFSISGFTDAAGNTGTTVTSTTDASTVIFDRTAPILTTVTIASNNANPAYAKPGDKVTLLFTSNEAIQTPTVSILGHSVTPTVVTGNQWKAEYTTVNADAEGTIAFQISDLKDLTGNNATNVVATTNGSSVIFDKTAPAVTGGCPSNQSVFAGASCTANVSWTIPVATDANVAGTLSAYEHTGGNPGTFNVGNYTIVYKFKDPAGNETICSFTISVADNAGPTFTTALTANPVVIWPPDHKLKNITLTYVTADNCSGTVTNNITVTSTDPITGVSDGDQSPDWIVVNDHLVQLRAERGNGRDARIYTITVTPVDASGNLGTPQSVQIYISHNITAPFTGTSFKIGSTVDFAGAFWDKAGNTHTAKWTLDDNTTVNGAVTEPSGSKNGKVTGSYKFTAAGIYKLQMNVTDQNRVTSYANTNEDLEEIIVVYDPDGGHTYGGGWFNSPAGALSANPGAVGKVSYGFSVNYYKNASLPKGETQFKFEVGGLEYNALNFDYLSISGAKAVFKGSGKIIGGQSGINFFMSVIDGALDGTGVDKVRIKIYNKNTGAVIYDNQPGASEAADPTQSVGAASSVVIVNNNTAAPAPRITSTEKNIQGITGKLQLMALPNPSRNHFTLALQGSRTEQANLRVTDMLGRVVEVRTGISANGTVKIGDDYRPGTYIAELIQGNERVRVMLIKQSQ